MDRIPWINKLRYSAIVLTLSNLVLCLLGSSLLLSSCRPRGTLPSAFVPILAALRLFTMVNTAAAQVSTARIVIRSSESVTVDAVTRIERRVKYKKWIWWTRVAMLITVLQFTCAIFLLVQMFDSVSPNDEASDCIYDFWKSRTAFLVFLAMTFFVPLAHFFAGSDVLRWRSFYSTEDNVWKAHYHELFDNGMREALCCLGRVKYLTVMEEDEIYSVARLLGDLVAYRASGTGHLELLAGLALFRRDGHASKHYEGLVEAHREQIEEAASLHKFAVAAYTGPLLDIGRNPLSFPCVWLYRQGILAPWFRSRWPVLQGDNWWRGHAAAFLKYLNLPPAALRCGRVSQGKCEAAYFIVVVHQLRTVVIAVRGTETPEDLITDGLGQECTLLAEDLQGLTNISCLDTSPGVETGLHYGHSGIVEAARDLVRQIEGNPDCPEDPSTGRILSSLLGSGCECEGYNLRIVGHSLGGAIATLLGIQLKHLYPNLRVYGFGSLPCVDSAVAAACSDFVTSIIYDNEFSARLSVPSILRLRASTLMALSQDTRTDTTLTTRLARRFLYLGDSQGCRIHEESTGAALNARATSAVFSQNISTDNFDITEQGKSGQSDDSLLLGGRGSEEIVIDVEHDKVGVSIGHAHSRGNLSEDPVTEFMERVPDMSSHSANNPPEVFLPGLIIHIVPTKTSELSFPMWRVWKSGTQETYKAYISHRENFKDIVVSPSMFLDHLPWRCHKAMQKILARSVTDS
ncbi:hypothetical protein MLD38_023873 [Melastoma candidum]|uniref:Uncharacterized protein n=1 Tax=Melastoma candidum TaxID=119954 RepID=A0ACB9NRL1_9MYRT|nr:hypothetical protein MLD38_023873 [Melastoma candidum]